MQAHMMQQLAAAQTDDDDDTSTNDTGGGRQHYRRSDDDGLEVVDLGAGDDEEEEEEDDDEEQEAADNVSAAMEVGQRYAEAATSAASSQAAGSPLRPPIMMTAFEVSTPQSVGADAGPPIETTPVDRLPSWLAALTLREVVVTRTIEGGLGVQIQSPAKGMAGYRIASIVTGGEFKNKQTNKQTTNIENIITPPAFR